ELPTLPEDDDPAHEREHRRYREDDDRRERVEKEREIRRRRQQHRDHRATSCPAMWRYVRPRPSSIVTAHCQPSDRNLFVAMHECCTSPGRAGACRTSTVRPDAFISSRASSFTLVSMPA